MLLALQGSVIEQCADYQVIRTPTNPSYHWGNFLLLDGPPAAGTVRSWMGTFAYEFPGADYVAIGVDGTGGEAGDLAELATAGLEASACTVLTAASTMAPPRPSEAAVFRMLDSDADWRAALDLQLAVRDYGDPGWQGFQGRRLQAKRHAWQELRARTQVIVAEPVGPAIRIYRSLGFRDAETQVQLRNIGAP